MPLQELNILGDLYRSGDPANKRQFAEQAVNLANQRGLGLQEFSASVGFDPTEVVRSMSEYGLTLNPQTGVQGAQNAISSGLASAQDRLSQTQGMVGGIYDQATQGLNPFVQPGQQANQLQAALSGALGPDAQREAFANYNMSPGVQFAQSEAERALLRNQAALGGLSGGNVRDELARRAAGTFAQDFSNQFGMIGDVATRGLSAAGSIGGLRGQQAGIQAGLGERGATFDFNAGMAMGDIRNQAGRDISAGVSSTVSALSNLLNQQGAGTSDIIAGGTQDFNRLIQLASAGDAAAKEQLATLLGNLSIQEGSSVSSLPMIQGNQPSYLAQVGQVASGVGGLMEGIGSMSAPVTAATSPSLIRQGPYAPAYGGYQ